MSGRKVGVGVGVLLVVALAALGSRESSPPAPVERVARPRPAATTQLVEAPVPGSSPVLVERGPIVQPWRRTALATVHAAPPLGLDDLGAEAGGESSVAVDPFTGQATLWERDVSLAGWPALRRSRTVGDRSTGLFGRGWRSEVDATLHRDGDGFVLVGIDGLTRLRPTGRGVWLTELGEVQALIATKDGGHEVDDPAGRIHHFDRTGRLVEIVGEVRIERIAGGLRLVGPKGELTLELDAAGRAARARGSQVDVRYAYEGDELVRVEGSARRSYRATGDGLEVSGAAGRLLVASVDDRGCVASIEAPTRGPGFVQRYTFERGLAEVLGPLGRWRYEAEGDGWRISTPSGPERAELDERGRVIALSVAGGPARPVARHDALERATQDPAPIASRTVSAWRGRDDAGRVVVEIGPAGRTTYERDGAGRVRARTDGAGRVIRAVRDRAGHVESIAGDAGSELAFEHDLAGRPTRAAAGDYALTFAWDELGRQTAEGGPDARLTWTRGPREERLQTPWGEVVRGADEAGRLVTLTSPAGTFRWEHDAQGRARRVRAPNGVVTELVRDAAAREAIRSARDRSGRSLLELATTRDASGLAIGLRRDGAELALARDAQGRLIRAGELTYAWSESADRLGGDTLVHDGAGRLVRREGPAGESSYSWDDLGRLTQVERRAPSGARETVGYRYDGLGRLATRTTSAGATRYVHADGQLLAELGPGERTRVWVHGPGLDAPLAYGDRAANGDAFTWTFLHGDATETTLAYSDASGARVARAVLGPFGETLEAAGERPVLFAGRPVDPFTGLVHLRARWYAPELGRFLDADPIGPDGGESPWLYCEGDPIERRDPMGLSPTPASAPPPVPTVWDRLVSAANTGVDLAARLVDASRVAAADVIAHEQATVRDYQVTLTRAGLLVPPGRERELYTESAISNFCLDTTSAALNGLLDARQAGLALLQDVIAPDHRDTGATSAFAQGWTETAIGVRKAIGRAQDHYGQVAELLVDDGHGLVSVGVQTGFIIVGDQLLPVAKTREVIEGKDLRHFVDTGDERLLTNLERVQRGIEVLSEVAGATAGALSNRAAKAARLADEATELARAGRAAGAVDEVADARRAAGAVPAREPNKGLAQVVDPDAERGVARATDAADGKRPRGEGPDGPTVGRPPRRELPVVQDDGCFLAGTLVETSAGRRPIETIAVGDRVLARSERTGATRWRRVTRLFPDLTAAVTSLWLASAGAGGSLELQTIRCTPNHPVWRAGDGFVRADALRPGDGLSSAASAPVLVLGVQTVGLRAATFNFEVEEDHTYFVSGRELAASIWVHNTCEEALRARFDADAAAGKTSKSWDEYRQDYVAKRTNELGFDTAQKKLQPHEGRIGAELELRGMVDGELERLPVPKNAPKGTKTPEWRETGGKRRTFDEIAGSIPDRFVEDQVGNDALKNALVEHFKKADVTVVQVTNMSPANKARVRALVDQLRIAPDFPAGKEVWVVDF